MTKGEQARAPAPVWFTIISVHDCDGTMIPACDVGGESGWVHTVPKHACVILRGPVPADPNRGA